MIHSPQFVQMPQEIRGNSAFNPSLLSILNHFILAFYREKLRGVINKGIDNAHPLIERTFFHAAGFETIAILIVSPLAAWIMQKPLFQMGSLAIMLSTVAMLWNMIYNSGFDRFYPLARSAASQCVRCMRWGLRVALF